MSIRIDQVEVAAYPPRVPRVRMTKDNGNFTGIREFDLTANAAVTLAAQNLINTIIAEAQSKLGLTVDAV